MREKLGTLKVQDGVELFTRQWLPDIEPKATLCIVHGYAEHCGRYEPLAAYLVKAGFEVVAYDHRGHGKSPGHRTFIERYELMIEDLLEVVTHFHSEDRPFFVLGHSMGGGILAAFAANHNIHADGLIFSSAALELPDPPGFFLRLVSNITSHLLPKGETPEMFYKLNPDLISRLPEEVNAYVQDPLVYRGKLLNRTGWELSRMIDDLATTMNKIDKPIYIIHGSADCITAPSGSKKLHDEAASSDKTLKIYRDGYHELFNDRCRAEAYDDLTHWLEQRC